jgi:predicted ester cyclase
MEREESIMKKLIVFVCLMIASCMVLSAQTKAGPSMCEQKARVILDKVLELWNKGNLALIPEIYTADCVATTSSSPTPFVGHEGIKQWIAINRTMMPDMAMAFPEVVAVPGKIVTIWTMTGTQTGPMVMPGGTMPPSGKKVSITGLSIDYLKDGKLAKEIVVMNTLEMLMQLGFQLVPPGAGK